jgi:hypothetical protein
MDEDTDDSYNFRMNWLNTRCVDDLFRFRGKAYLPLVLHKKPDFLLVDIMMLITD